MTGVKPLDTWLQMWLRRLRLAFCARSRRNSNESKKEKVQLEWKWGADSEAKIWICHRRKLIFCSSSCKRTSGLANILPQTNRLKRCYNPVKARGRPVTECQTQLVTFNVGSEGCRSANICLECQEITQRDVMTACVLFHYSESRLNVWPRGK